MNLKNTIYGTAAVILLGGSLVGQTSDTAEPQQVQGDDQVQNQIQDQVQNQLGPLADELTQLRLSYREQVQVMLEERARLIQMYRLATEDEQAAIRMRLREHQAKIAEAHRHLRREMRDQMREIRDERRTRMQHQGG